VIIWLVVGMVGLAGFAAGWVLGIAYGVHREQEARSWTELMSRHGYGPPLLTYSDEPRIRVTRGPYDHEAGGDFDG
jgi:hypothetical protein